MTFNCFNCQGQTSFMLGRGLCEECMRAAAEAQTHAGPSFAERDYAAQQALALRHRESTQKIIDPMATA